MEGGGGRGAKWFFVEKCSLLVDRPGSTSECYIEVELKRHPPPLLATPLNRNVFLVNSLVLIGKFITEGVQEWNFTVCCLSTTLTLSYLDRLVSQYINRSRRSHLKHTTRALVTVKQHTYVPKKRYMSPLHQCQHMSLISLGPCGRSLCTMVGKTPNRSHVVPDTEPIRWHA